MFVEALAVLALGASPQDRADDGPLRLEDVVVDARRLEDAARDYVDLVAEPVRGRSLARWREGVCVGVANLDRETAQYLADRISDTVRGVGLTSHVPECHPSVIIVATTDGAAFAEQFVARRPRLFRAGGSGMDRGPAALRDFTTQDRAVRWWHVSLPVDAETGEPAVRLPGQINGSGADDGQGSVWDYAPVTRVHAPSRLNTQYESILKRVFIIVDVDRLNGATPQQLADYLAMVALAQIDPEADTGRFDTILNLFDDPAAAPAGLTGWDRAYLEGLYSIESGTQRADGRIQVRAVGDAIARAYRAAPEDAPEDSPATPTP